MIMTWDKVLTCGFWLIDYESVSEVDVNVLEDEWDGFFILRNGFPRELTGTQ